MSAPRHALRAILAGDQVARPASVHDALSMRAAQLLGFPLGMLGGSVAALAVLGAPDHQLLSLDEFAGLCRRMCRACDLPLLVDADHGFGPALHVLRCVQELEVAGVAGLTLEDTDLPQRYASAPGLIAVDEAVDKLRAALHARHDPALVIVARTDARLQDAGSLIARARAYGAVGADALFITGAQDPDLVARAGQAAGLPIIIPEPKGALAQADLAALGVRICLTPHRPFPAGVAAVWDALAATPGAQAVPRPDDLIAALSRAADYEAWRAEFLKH